MESASAGREGRADRLPTTKGRGRRIGQRRGATRAPTQGPRPEPGAGAARPRPPPTPPPPPPAEQKPKKKKTHPTPPRCLPPLLSQENVLPNSNAKRQEFQF